MCGIAVLVGSKNLPQGDQDRLENIGRALQHRGPDGIRFDVLPELGLAMAHTRLSVIDLETGWQPMHSEDDQLILCFNGEIYNYRELRNELIQLGHAFRTQSDSEVLLTAYQHWGIDCLDRLNGIFAFCIFDRSTETLFFARDPIGIKPLYFEEVEGGLVVCSEMRPLAIHRESAPKISRAALLEYCAIGYVLAPKTILEGIRQLPHGHYGIWRNGELAISRYFDLATCGRSGDGNGSASIEEEMTQVESLIEAAVSRQLVSDIPVGTFLSGGIDSSLITSLAKQKMPSIRTFTADFREKGYSEAEDASRLAGDLGVSNDVFEVSEQDLLEGLDEIIWATDAPIFDNSCIPLYMLCKRTRPQVSVVLAGDGGDEVFLGYPTFLADRLAQRLRTLPRALHALIRLAAKMTSVEFGKVTWSYKLKAFARSFARPAAMAHCGWREIVAPEFLERMFPELSKAEFAELHPMTAFQRIHERAEGFDLLTAMSYLDFETWLPNDILVKADRMSMAHGLELRVPLLDVDLVKKCMTIPGAMKLKGFELKWILKKLISKVTPSYKIKAKRGFNAPMSEWLNGSLAHMLDDMMRSKLVAEQFDSEVIKELVAEHRSETADHGHFLWALVVLGKWWDKVESNRSAMECPS